MQGGKDGLVVGIGDEHITDIVHAADAVPGAGAACSVAGILLGGDRSQRERPALAEVVGGRGLIMTSVGGGAGVGEGKLRHGSRGPGATVRG